MFTNRRCKKNLNKVLVTRRPLELRLIHIPYQEQISPYATFEEIKGLKFTDFKIVKEKIVELTELVAGKNRNIVNIPIKLNIYSNTCPDLTLIDLPGITRIPIFGISYINKRLRPASKYP